MKNCGQSLSSHKYLFTYIYMHTSICIRTYVHVNMYTCICIHTHIQTLRSHLIVINQRVVMYAYIYTYVYTYTYKYIYILSI